jgi:MYXO-CTERM domain-containing protein
MSEPRTSLKLTIAMQFASRRDSTHQFLEVLMRIRPFLPSLFLALCFSVPAARAENPIIQTKYTADPAPMVYKDVLYLYTSHDEDNASGFTMYNWMLYTTTDMVNWTDHGMVGGVKAPYNTFTWAGGNSAWAPQTVERDGKFYMYVPIMGNKGKMTIAVAMADSPFGPFKDPLGKSLADTGTSDDIDPTVFIDKDEQAYLFWGNPNVYYVKLNKDMISYSGSITKLPKVQTYQEGPWFYGRDDKYYLAFASTCCPEGIGYAMATSPTGPWTYKNSIMDGDQRSSGNHPGIVDYKGSTYVFGFNYLLSYPQTATSALPGGHTERRSICVQKMTYSADGTIAKLPFWDPKGVAQVGSLNPYVQTEAETIAWSEGLKTETCSEGGMMVTEIQSGDYIKVKGVDFGGGATSLDVRVASAGSGGNIEVRLESKTGTLVGTCAVAGTGGAQTWATKTCPISGASGAHDLFLVFTGSGTGSLFNFNWWKFTGTASDGGVGGQGGNDAGTSTGGSGGTGAAGTSGSTTSLPPVGGSSTGGKGGSSSGGTTSGKAGSSGSGGANSTGGTSSSQGGQSTSVSSGASAGGGRSSASSTSASSSSVAQGGNSSSSATSSGVSSSTTTPTAAGDSSGCSCAVGGSSGRRDAVLALVLGLALIGLRRRRSDPK